MTTPERIFRYPYERIDATCSRLYRVGDVCDLAVHCNDSTLILDTRGQNHDSIFTEAEYGQTFFCPSEDFVSYVPYIQSSGFSKQVQYIYSHVNYLIAYHIVHAHFCSIILCDM